MILPNIFEQKTADSLIQRINNLKADTEPNWGKMNAAQMLAHCNVAYEMTFEDKHQKPNFLMRFILKKFLKKSIVSPDIPYQKNSRTAPAFLISDERDFDKEKERLIQYLLKSASLGENYFDNKESLSFGKMSKEEWNCMFYKHLEHHFTQFGI